MRRIAPILLLGLGLLLLLATGGWLYFNKSSSDPTSLVLPNQIAGLTRTEQTSGPQAIRDFENLHGEQFPVTSRSIGIFGN